jgi:hypothetical protein
MPIGRTRAGSRKRNGCSNEAHDRVRTSASRILRSRSPRLRGRSPRGGMQARSASRWTALRKRSRPSQPSARSLASPSLPPSPSPRESGPKTGSRNLLRRSRSRNFSQGDARRAGMACRETPPGGPSTEERHRRRRSRSSVDGPWSIGRARPDGAPDLRTDGCPGSDLRRALLDRGVFRVLAARGARRGTRLASLRPMVRR